MVMSSSHTDDSLTFHCLKQKYGASGGNMKTFIDYELDVRGGILTILWLDNVCLESRA